MIIDMRTNVWQSVDITFSAIFVCELILKCFLHGILSHFCGRDKFSNSFDAALIVCDAIQVVALVFSTPYLGVFGNPSYWSLPMLS